MYIINEEWTKIDEFPWYEVSTLGRVRSIDRDYVDSIGRRRYKRGQLIKLEVQIGKKDNYKQIMVSLRRDGKLHRVIVARLVAMAFIPNPDLLPQVNHKDEDSTNNNVENLEWCTAKYNVNYNDCVKRRAKTRSRPVNVYDGSMNIIDTLPSSVEASKKYNICRSSISQCCNGNIDFVKGLTFRFC